MEIVMSIHNFLCDDQFLYRIPRNSLAFAEKILDNIFDEQFDMNDLKDALLVSSESLYTEWKNGCSDKGMEAIQRYLLRSATRTTPNNLWAGVGIGAFSTVLQSKIEKTNFYSKITPDHIWINELVNYLEDYFQSQLRITLNNTVTVTKDFVVNNWLSNFYNNISNTRIQVKNTSIIFIILKEVEDSFLTISDLQKIVNRKAKNSELNFAHIINFLIKNEFVISDFRIRSLENDPLAGVLDVLSSYVEPTAAIYVEIENIYNLFTALKQLKLGEYEAPLLKLESKMKKYAECSRYFSVELLNSSMITIPKSIKEDVLRLCDYFDKFCESNMLYDEIYEYILEQYNETYVPIMKLYDRIENVFTNISQSDLSGSSMDYILQSILNKSDKIIHLDYPVVTSTQSKCKRPFEIALNIYTDLNGKYVYALSSMLGSNKKGQNLNKYIDVFQNNLPETLGADTQEYCEVEILFYPREHEILNIMLVPLTTKYVLIYGAPSNFKLMNDGIEYISIDDIYVYAHEGNLFFFSKRLGKRLEFIVNNKVNENKLPFILRFLLNCTDNYYSSMFSLIKKIEKITHKLSFSPRVMYDNFILHPCTWSILSYFGEEECKSFNDFVSIIEKMKIELKLPRKIYITNPESDQYLRINLDNTLNLHILYKEFKRYPNIMLVEDLSQSYTPIVTNKLGEPYCSDFIFFVDPKKNEFFDIPCVQQKFLEEKCDDEATLLPFQGGWLYLKIYTKASYQEYVMTNFLGHFCNSLREKRIIYDFYFVRYIDNEGTHIRLRLKYNKEYIHQLFIQLYSIQRKLIDHQLIKKITIETYHREVIRYGGSSTIGFAEEVFCNDSIFVINLLTNKQIRDKFSKVEIAIISTLFLLDDFGVTNSEKKQIMGDFFLRANYTPEYRRIRTKILSCFQTIQHGDISEAPVLGELYDLLKKRSVSIKCYGEILRQKMFDREFLYDVIRDVIHMHFNRIFGPNKRREKETAQYVFLTLISLEKMKLI